VFATNDAGQAVAYGRCYTHGDQLAFCEAAPHYLIWRHWRARIGIRLCATGTMADRLPINGPVCNLLSCERCWPSVRTVVTNKRHGCGGMITFWACFEDGTLRKARLVYGSENPDSGRLRIIEEAFTACVALFHLLSGLLWRSFRTACGGRTGRFREMAFSAGQRPKTAAERGIFLADAVAGLKSGTGLRVIRICPDQAHKPCAFWLAVIDQTGGCAITD